MTMPEMELGRTPKPPKHQKPKNAGKATSRHVRAQATP